MVPGPDCAGGTRSDWSRPSADRSATALLRAGCLRFDERRIIAGRDRNRQSAGRRQLVFSPANKTRSSQTIERWNAPIERSRRSAENRSGSRLTRADFCRARLCRVAPDGDADRDEPFSRGSFLDREGTDAHWRPYDLRLATQELKCQVVSIEEVMDSSTLESKHRATRTVERNEVGQTHHPDARATRPG